mmetsp:Transcript_37897/g.88689  ORF Transcript_37897/g.88689 Transcript_37897/m.88689 type:complete len:213 (-) Transcript_37897:97-735(-)
MGWRDRAQGRNPWRPGTDPGMKWLAANPATAIIAMRPFFSSLSRILSAATFVGGISLSGSNPMLPGSRVAVFPSHRSKRPLDEVPSMTPIAATICSMPDGFLANVEPSADVQSESVQNSPGRWRPPLVARIPAKASILSRPCFSSASRSQATSGLLALTFHSSVSDHGSHGASPNSTEAPTYSESGLRSELMNSWPMPEGANGASYIGPAAI